MTVEEKIAEAKRLRAQAESLSQEAYAERAALRQAAPESERVTCPRRMTELGPWKREEGLDRWENGTCSFCGSIFPGTFMAAATGGSQLAPTDKNYKVYVGDRKFYFQHLDEEKQRLFVDLLNGGRLSIDYPGYFYVLPFFVRK